MINVDSLAVFYAAMVKKVEAESNLYAPDSETPLIGLAMNNLTARIAGDEYPALASLPIPNDVELSRLLKNGAFSVKFACSKHRS